METRANYILIGAFTLAGVIGALAFILWFARVEIDRQFAYFDVSFDSVSGLGVASDVRFSGLPVGQVVDVVLSPDGDGSIRVRLEVSADTPVRTDSTATIESQGVTGVSFVGISAGTPEAALLVPGEDGAIPRLEAGQSALQSLTEDAPALLSEAVVIAQEVSALLGGENRGRVERILENVEDASDDFSVALAGFSEVTGSVSDFAVQIDSFNTTLADLTDAMTGVLDSADGALTSIGALAEDSRGVVEGVEGVLAEADRFVAEDLSPATEEVRLAVAAFRARFDGLASGTEAALAEATTTFASASETLVSARTTLATGDRALSSAERAFDGADRVINDEVAGIVADLRTTLAGLDGAVAQVSAEIPAIAADLRAASTAARESFTEISRVVGVAGTSVDSFASTALPSYASLAREARTLVANLDSLVTRIGRDPARVLLNQQTPEFRR